MVAIVVLNWNGWGDTIECLESLRRITYRNTKVIIVDNGSSDDSVDRIRDWAMAHIPFTLGFLELGRHPRWLSDDGSQAVGLAAGDNTINMASLSHYKMLLLTTGANLGYAGGNNVGIRCARDLGAQRILLLNNDTIVDERFLEPLVKASCPSGQAGIVGPMVYYRHQPSEINFAGGRINFWKGTTPHLVGDNASIGQQGLVESDYQEGSAILIRPDVFDKIGMLDEGYFLLWEDSDFGYRAKKAGFRVLCVLESKIWHSVHGASGGSTTRSPVLTYYEYRNRIRFMKLYASPYHWPTFLGWLCYSGIRLLAYQLLRERKLPGSLGLAMMRGIIAGFVGR